MRSSEGASGFGKERFRRVGKVCLGDLSGVNRVKVCSVMQWAGTERPCERPTEVAGFPTAVTPKLDFLQQKHDARQRRPPHRQYQVVMLPASCHYI